MALGTAVDVYQQFYPSSKDESAISASQHYEPISFILLKCFSINLNGKRVYIETQMLIFFISLVQFIFLGSE